MYLSSTSILENTAKLYALDWLHRRVLQTSKKMTILDLGCGDGTAIRGFLQDHPHIHYIGVEPRKTNLALAAKNLPFPSVRLVRAFAYEIDKEIKQPVDIVLSFSTLEHVYNKADYLACMYRCLKKGGYGLINYDCGSHFEGWYEQFVTMVGHALATLGIEQFYRSYLTAHDAEALLQHAGFEILEHKRFNLTHKGLGKALLPEPIQPRYLKRWLAFELWLNEHPIWEKPEAGQFFFSTHFLVQK